MGSQSKDQTELTVLVTGFGPFREQYPANPSWEIAKGIPSHLPPLRAKDTSSREALKTPPVRILVPPEPIRVNYKVVRDLVPGFWDTYQGHKVDMAIHIGMASPRPFYQIERRAHRRGYKSLDVDNEMLVDGPEGKVDDEDWIWHGLPDEILSDFDIDDVHSRWQRLSSKDMDLRVSEDPGRYLCDFIYYSSLAHLYKASRPRKVVFLHVPSDASDTYVSRGRELTMNLIRALVESETAAKSDLSGNQETGA
ncbi:Peptidase C15, pyroglutamyl peptidase I-like protein [Metarhizium rileyi]|uniref:Peptidase C15, pyroglutamyl peptidase I-like protein n=1 Tax=Metarhizium rileyi (strain RCEF 4871) TaxID=1649241 RepID=A0A166YT54_METRR|nr:Peptidase C15, pyroglutamyl peptidase I-like protein [Metarhizium rileyi RCEF 4871]